MQRGTGTLVVGFSNAPLEELLDALGRLGAHAVRVEAALDQDATRHPVGRLLALAQHLGPCLEEQPRLAVAVAVAAAIRLRPTAGRGGGCIGARAHALARTGPALAPVLEAAGAERVLLTAAHRSEPAHHLGVAQGGRAPLAQLARAPAARLQLQLWRQSGAVVASPRLQPPLVEGGGLEPRLHRLDQVRPARGALLAAPLA